MKAYYEDGSVTIYHGDCREVVPGLGMERCGAVITDPPYEETSLEWDKWPAGWPSMAATIGPQLWCFGSMRMFLEKRDEFKSWTLAQDVIWEKQNGSGLASDRFRRVHETLTHFYRGPWESLYHEAPKVPRGAPMNKTLRRSTKPAHFGGIDRGEAYEYGAETIERSVIYARNCHGYAKHPTQKPVSIVVPLICYSVPPGGLVVDLFAGSGTTGRAAKDAGRRAILIEISERYCEIAARRMCQEVLDLRQEAEVLVR